MRPLVVPAVWLAEPLRTSLAAGPGPTVIDGCDAIVVRFPPDVDFCLVVHVCEPAVVAAVAPGPPLALLP